MTRPVNEAAKPNPSLQPWKILVGTWDAAGSHPMMPGVALHGRATFEWIEGGAFLLMRSRIEEPRIPSGISIIGFDDTSREGSMLYFDERGVSRVYQTSLQGNTWKWWRNATDFSQRFEGTISPDGRTITCRGEMSREGKGWEPDLALTYTRAS